MDNKNIAVRTLKKATILLALSLSAQLPLLTPLAAFAQQDEAAGQNSEAVQARKVPVAGKVMAGNFVSPFDILALPSAVQFPVVFDTDIDSRNAREGDLVEAHLKEDLVFDNRLIAGAGSAVIGHIGHYVKSRNMAQAMISGDKRFRKNSIVKINFEEIITPDFEHIKIEGVLSKQKVIFGEGVEREVIVGKDGIVEKAEQSLSEDTMVGAQVVNFTVSTGLSQLGSVASFGVLPVVMGAIGAVNPSIVTMKAVTKEDRHPRLRGMTMGVVSSLPGGPVLQSLVYHGSELNIKKGDELLVQAHSPYNDLTTMTQVSAKISPKRAADGTLDPDLVGHHYYPKYQPKYIPKAGTRVLGTTGNSEDRFGLWK
ncbi:MAG: hypothetical protein KGS72_19925 [Cyanobacteria bacterium REEB67]|nr:hypothetical protein [Cyanobacteria bacterium REEB67]